MRTPVVLNIATEFKEEQRVHAELQQIRFGCSDAGSLSLS